MKKLVSFALTLAILISLLVVPAAAAEHKCSVNGEATVTKNNSIGTTYNSYSTLSDAEYHQVTVYADGHDFPIKVRQQPYGCSASTDKITTYGTHRVIWKNF